MQHAFQIIREAMCLALFRSGWQIKFAPGIAPELTREPHSITPSEVLASLQSENLSADEWLAFCERLEICELRLDPRQTGAASE